MTWVHRIDGAPGAGKTHTLLNKIGAEREDGVDIEDILFLTFTNAARKDAKEEISERFDDITRNDADDMVYTIHGAALGAVAAAGYIDQDDSIIQPGDDPYYEQFAEQNGMNYAGASVRDLEKGDRIDGNGDVFFALNSWLASTYRSAKDARRAPIEFPWLNVDTFEDLQRKWDRYKKTVESDRRLWEHHDYLEKAIKENVYPLADVVLIDEFQDFSPLQYKYYKDMRDHGDVERIYIAGDPNQSVYSFRGADPYYFNETDYDKETQLNETRRCRDEIATLARRLLQTSDRNESRPFTATREGGVVRSVRGEAATVEAAIESATASETDTVMLLARTNKQWKRLARFLRKKGFPYEVLGTRGWSMWDMNENAEVLRALTQLRDSEYADGIETARLIENLPDGAVNTDELVMETVDGDPVYNTESLWRALDYERDVTAVTDSLQIKESYRTAIERVLARGNDNRKGQIRVGTIHASKGLEADTVLLFPAYNRNMYDRYTMDREVRAEEHRVAYVAATRARDRLYVVRDFFGSKTTMPMFEKPPVREVLS